MFCTTHAAATSDSRGSNSVHQACQVSGSCTGVAQNNEGQLHAQLYQQCSQQLHLVLAALPVSPCLQTRGFSALGLCRLSVWQDAQAAALGTHCSPPAPACRHAAAQNVKQLHLGLTATQLAACSTPTQVRLLLTVPPIA